MRLRHALPAALLPALLLAGCGHSPPTRFLTLDAAPPAAPAGDGHVPPLRVTAVRVPASVDRMEFVTVPGPGRIVVHDQDRWAAAPGELAREALLHDLALRLPAGGVLPLDAAATPASWRVALDILSIDADATGARMAAVLTLARDAGGAPVRIELTLTDGAPIDIDDPAQRPVETAQAYGRLLGQVADRIVAATAAPVR